MFPALKECQGKKQVIIVAEVFKQLTNSENPLNQVTPPRAKAGLEFYTVRKEKAM